MFKIYNFVTKSTVSESNAKSEDKQEYVQFFFSV